MQPELALLVWAVVLTFVQMLVAVSGHRGEDLQHRMAEAGFDEYMGKPFDLAQLEEVIHRGRA